MGDHLDMTIRIAAALLGIGCIFYFFKSIIRVGVLNQRYQDPLAFWIGRLVMRAFQCRIALLRMKDRKANELLTWYWPMALIGIISAWFLLVTLGFALLNWAFLAKPTFIEAIISSGSALSTLGFSTPPSLSGQILAIIEGAIGLFLIVYLFTFLPGFMDLIHERGLRVEWVYARTNNKPSGAALIEWYATAGRLDDLNAIWEDWEVFFRNLGQSKSFLPILSVIRPLIPTHSWVCAFGALLDALALLISSVEKDARSARLCFDCGVESLQIIHSAMRGSLIVPRKSPDLLHVRRADYDVAWNRLAAAGLPMAADQEAAWLRFIECHKQYEQEIAWMAATLSDPFPYWHAEK